MVTRHFNLRRKGSNLLITRMTKLKSVCVLNYITLFIYEVSNASIYIGTWYKEDNSVSTEWLIILPLLIYFTHQEHLIYQKSSS